MGNAEYYIFDIMDTWKCFSKMIDCIKTNYIIVEL